MLIVWKEEFSIDRGPVDQDHKHLIGLLNKIIATVGAGRGSALLYRYVEQLGDYATQHFEREERLQEATGYPGLEHHRNEHRILLNQLNQMIEHLAEMPPADMVLKSSELKSFFYRWILGHIIDSDLKIRPYVEAAETLRKSVA